METNQISMDFCAIDFETACQQRASACALGMVQIHDGKIIDTFYSLIRPPAGMDILPFFTEIHGITMTDVSTAPDFEELWPRIQAFIRGDFLVAHNSSFDQSVLESCLEYYDIDFSPQRFECTLQCSRRRWPELENHQLDTISEFLGIELDHHNALSDALACAHVYLEAHA